MSNLQKLIIDIVFKLVILSSVLCAIVLIYLSTITSFSTALSFVVVLMVASIPMGMHTTYNLPFVYFVYDDR
jgi:hypothetical protein